MDTTSEAGDVYNTAVADIIAARKTKLRLTYEEIAERSGVNARTLKRLLMDERPFKMGQFIAVVSALELDPADVMLEVERIIKLQSAKSSR